MTESGIRASRNYHHGDLRLALIEQAEVWMRHHAGWGFTLREIARDVGVSHNAPYKHFADKAALLATLGERAFGRLSQHLAQAMSKIDPDDVSRQIEAAAVAYVGFALAEPAAFRLMFGEDLADCAEPGFRRAADAAFATISAVIDRGVATNRLRADLDGAHAATAWALVHGLSFLMIDGRLTSDRETSALNPMAAVAARTLIMGLRAEG